MESRTKRRRLSALARLSLNADVLLKERMTRLAQFFLIVGLASGCSNLPQDAELRGQLTILRSGPFGRAEEVGRKIVMNDRHFPYGMKENDVAAILGRPDFRYFDTAGVDIFYRTSAGPLMFSFQSDRLIHKALNRPVRWRGTNEELEQSWDRKKNAADWYEWNDASTNAWDERTVEEPH